MKISENLIEEVEQLSFRLDLALDMNKIVFEDLYVSDKINTATREEKKRYAPILLGVMQKVEEQRNKARHIEKNAENKRKNGR